MRRIVKFEPSSKFTAAGISTGDVFSIGGEHKPKYLLLHIDPWYAHCCRYYWFDKYLSMWYEWRKRANNKD